MDFDEIEKLAKKAIASERFTIKGPSGIIYHMTRKSKTEMMMFLSQSPAFCNVGGGKKIDESNFKEMISWYMKLIVWMSKKPKLMLRSGLVVFRKNPEISVPKQDVDLLYDEIQKIITPKHPPEVVDSFRRE